MKYSNLEWTIGELINLIESQKINLRPPYQRNFIWSSKDRKPPIKYPYKKESL